ncbi:MAG: radical SAM protein [archaeon]|nr:radical SAM protein [archaeon]
MERQKVILMYPNSKWTIWMERTAWSLHPYNIGLLKAMIEPESDVSFIDANIEDMTQEQFAKKIEEEKPDVLGISVLTNEYAEAGNIASRIAKQVNPNIKTVMGGVHAISSPEDAMQEKSLDFVVNGEGEYVFRDLCKSLAGKGDLPQKGILFRKNDEVINLGRADFITDLDALPYPSYKGIDFMKYATRSQRETTERPLAMPFAHILTSRGCPYRCCFCEAGLISGKKPRLRGVGHIQGELEQLIQNYEINAFIIDDDNWLIDKPRAKSLLKLFKNYNLSWNPITVALYQLDDEMVPLLKESGMHVAQISFESGVKRVLRDIVHKPLDLEKGKKMVDRLKSYDISTVANFIVGFPGETWDEIRETLKFAEDINVDYVKINIATPLPNTDLYEKARAAGYLSKGFHFNQHLWSRGWIETSEFKPQDLKVLRAYEWDRINFSTPEKRKKIAYMMGVSEERLTQIRKNTLETAHKI